MSRRFQARCRAVLIIRIGRISLKHRAWCWQNGWMIGYEIRGKVGQVQISKKVTKDSMSMTRLESSSNILPHNFET